MSLSTEQKLRYYKNPVLAELILKSELIKRKLITYGARASNVQLPPYLRKKTTDYDVLANKPKRTALEILKKLNKEFGGEFFSIKKAEHKGTYKIVSNVTKKTLLDVTQKKRTPKTTTIRGITYRKLPSIKKAIQRVIKKPSTEFRREKDLELLQRINLSKGVSGLWW